MSFQLRLLVNRYWAWISESAKLRSQYDPQECLEVANAIQAKICDQWPEFNLHERIGVK